MKSILHSQHTGSPAKNNSNERNHTQITFGAFDTRRLRLPIFLRDAQERKELNEIRLRKIQQYEEISQIMNISMNKEGFNSVKEIPSPGENEEFRKFALNAESPTLRRKRIQIAQLKRQIKEETKRQIEEYKTMGHQKACEIFNDDTDGCLVKQPATRDYESYYYTLLEEDYNTKCISKFNWSGKDVTLKRYQNPVRINKILIALMSADPIIWMLGL